MTSDKIDECLETLWNMRERGDNSLRAFESETSGYHEDDLAGLLNHGFVDRDGDCLTLTPSGEERARRLIRSHRLAERLVHDVLRSDYEEGACAFEHVINPELVDSICTLLGHPRECPHGMAIPPGECCRKGAEQVTRSVVPLVQLGVGQESTIAYVYGETDGQLHRLDNLQIRPGVRVRVHQKYPSFVIECENATVALDENVASSIHVWAVPTPQGSMGRQQKRRRRRSGR